MYSIVITISSYENHTIVFGQDGYTPLHWAALNGLEECVKVMLQLPDISAVVRMQSKVSRR